MKKILIVNLGGLGDLLLSTPALRGLKDLYPEAEVTMLTSCKGEEFVKRLPYLNKVICFDIRFGGIISFKCLIRYLILIFKLKKEQFDLAINMRTLMSVKSAKKINKLFRIINPKMKAGRDTDNRGHFFDIKMPETTQGEKYEMEYDIDMIRTLGGEVEDKKIDFLIEEEDTSKINSILDKNKVKDSDVLIGIHPGGIPSRRWPVDNFIKMLEEIKTNINFKIVVTGDIREKILAIKISKHFPDQVMDLTGNISIYQLGALIKRCRLYISNDTGPMHIAAALQVPLVAIFGPGDITRFNPINISNKVKVFYKKAECAPCEKFNCDDLKCLKKIDPIEVSKACLELLEK